MHLPEGYEQHKHKDPTFPIIFRYDRLTANRNFLMHWHENIEILCFTEGRCTVLCDTIPVEVSAGDIAIVNSCALHHLRALTPYCRYYCLIVDKTFCNDFKIPVGEMNLRMKITDEISVNHIINIVQEMKEKAPYYKTIVKAEVLQLLSRLYRNETDNELISALQIHPLDMVRKGITFIRQHYCEELSVDDICGHVGFSKYYFCRNFKRITGKTVVNYINFLRCDHARRLLMTGQCNVSESAERCGFHNMSYFTKTYKKQFGILPSQTVDSALDEI